MLVSPGMGVAGRVFAALITLVAVASLVLQYLLILGVTRENIGPALGTLRYFSYFTILSNIAVVLVAIHAALARPGFFSSLTVRGGVTLYIAVTGGIYFFILRHLWSPQGAQWWADTGLHYAVPLLYLMWWLSCVPHGGLSWRQVGMWLTFPALYVCWAFLRGAWVHEYPYPFIDVAQLGWSKVLMNSAGMLLLFVVVGLVLVGVDRLLGRRPKASL
ncbi:Pr6Pr family membrane protein [Pseudoxanthomonas sp. UTMC 1351]|uniref:Pr6Pr family membrane protein n=1 Tax=Pseudoxanthomonas sp. UTMC 1351 TaxID=2695853 RepID=UPI0034CE40BC